MKARGLPSKQEPTLCDYCLFPGEGERLTRHLPGEPSDPTASPDTGIRSYFGNHVGSWGRGSAWLSRGLQLERNLHVYVSGAFVCICERPLGPECSQEEK